jgi:hypothetical protein
MRVHFRIFCKNKYKYSNIYLFIKIFTKACGSNTRKCRTCFPGQILSIPDTTVPYLLPLKKKIKLNVRNFFQKIWIAFKEMIKNTYPTP